MASPISNTFTVWHALFLREALDRFFGARAGWAWQVIEPAAHMMLMCGFFSLYRPSMGSVDVFTWICMGMLGFFLFRRTAVQTQHAVDCNRAFFAFRQVRPFDAAFARGGVEAFSMFLVSLVIIIPMAFLGKQAWPADVLLCSLAMWGLWLLGFGYGMITSVIQRLVPESGHIFAILMMPLYILSGVIMPVSNIPMPYQRWLMYNPIAHGLEYVRHGFIHNYRMAADASLGYFFAWIFAFILAGLILYKLYDTRLVMQ